MSMEFPRQEYWSQLPFPSPGDLPDPRIEPVSPMSSGLAGGFFTTKPPGKPHLYVCVYTYMKILVYTYVLCTYALFLYTCNFIYMQYFLLYFCSVFSSHKLWFPKYLKNQFSKTNKRYI